MHGQVARAPPAKQVACSLRSARARDVRLPTATARTSSPHSSSERSFEAAVRKERSVILVGDAKETLAALEIAVANAPNKLDEQLVRSIHRALDRLKRDPFAGDPIPKRLIPNRLRKLPNLFRLELSQFWRLLYYLTGDEIRILAVVCEICDHKKYDALFGYKKR